MAMKLAHGLRGTAPMLSPLLSRVATAWRDYRRVSQTRQELARLSDRELNDIGLDRSRIAHAARGTVR